MLKPGEHSTHYVKDMGTPRDAGSLVLATMGSIKWREPYSSKGSNIIGK